MKLPGLSIFFSYFPSDIKKKKTVNRTQKLYQVSNQLQSRSSVHRESIQNIMLNWQTFHITRFCSKLLLHHSTYFGKLYLATYTDLNTKLHYQNFCAFGLKIFPSGCVFYVILMCFLPSCDPQNATENLGYPFISPNYHLKLYNIYLR